MKKFGLIFAVVLTIVCVAAAVSIKPLLLSFAQKELKHTFKATSVSIEHCRLYLDHIEFSNVSIRISKYYTLSAQEIDLYMVGIVVKELGGMLEVNGKDMTVEHGFLDLKNIDRPGSLTIAGLQYDKVKITSVMATVRVQGKDILLDPSFAQMLDGTVQSKMHLTLGDAPQFLIQISCAQISLPGIVQAYQLNEKVALTGALAGHVTISGRATLSGVKLDLLNGNLSSMGREGTVTINDPQILQDLAQHIHQPQDIVVESFKDYHYNMAIVTLFLDRDGNLNVGFAMDGEKGKRDLQVVVHDFGIKTKRRW